MIWLQLLYFASAPAGCRHDFFGLVTWYHYLPDKDFGVTVNGVTYACNINTNFNFISAGGSDLPLILLAVVDDLLRIAGIVAVAFVFYGAIKYIASQGDPEATARAQGTVINALIGMAIAMVSVAVVSFIGNKLS
ncbi:MAG TPA: hypothetical protein VLF79_01370 [Candidatus Saccharimonadales bacterium]|nr:hypothetical protein [Candidatus Saccharimonadales bacterium]